MNNNEYDFIYLIFNYLKHIEKADKITKYLYNHTELFEKKYMQDYPAELFKFFSGKIGRYCRERNKLLDLLDNKQIEKLKKIEILEG